jgi:HNH endonuclease
MLLVDHVPQNINPSPSRELITAERLRELLHYDPPTGIFRWLVRPSNCVQVGAIAGGVNRGHGYLVITLDGRHYLAQRLAHLYMTGSWPQSEIIHLNLDHIDNRWVNLREATYNSPVTAEWLRERLSYDSASGIWTWRMTRGHVAVGSVAGKIDGQGYRAIPLDGRNYRSSRLAHLYMTGEWPKNEMDHINLNRSDDRWDNLREATPTQNRANRPANNKSGHLKGTYWNKRERGWHTSIRANGVRYYLGLFSTQEAAHAAYAAAAAKHFGEFGRLS